MREDRPASGPRDASVVPGPRAAPTVPLSVEERWDCPSRARMLILAVSADSRKPLTENELRSRSRSQSLAKSLSGRRIAPLLLRW
jgi:hypothetical protein